MHLELYRSLDKFKEGAGGEFTALCPFHDDSQRSFTGNYLKGVYYCHSCGAKGHSVDFAKKMGYYNPEQYITNTHNRWDTENTYDIRDTDNTLKPNPVDRLKSTASPPNDELIATMNRFKNNIIKNSDKYPDDLWDESFIDEGLVALDDSGKYVWGYYDYNSNLTCYQHHKGHSVGDTAVKWYLGHKIADYSREKPLYIAEGQKDALCLLSEGFQVVSSSNGALNVPDVELIKDWCEYRIPYDNDEAGYTGAMMMNQKIQTVSADYVKCLLYQWMNKPDKWDIYDEFKDDRMRFLNDDVNWVEVQLKTEEQIKQTAKKKVKGFKMFKLSEFRKKKYPETVPIIDNILYKGQTAIIGGDTGTKKSWVALQSALSIASGVSLFGHFEVKPQKVLLFQYENENYDIQSRYELMIEDYIRRAGNDDWVDNIMTMEISKDDEDFVDNWVRIEQTLIDEDFRDGAIVVDNIYTSTDKDLVNPDDVKHLCRTVNNVRKDFKLTILLIAHTVKNASFVDKCLHYKQIQGASVLSANIANISMIGNSMTSADLNLFKICKGGRSDKNELLDRAFKLHWSDDTCNFTKGSIVLNEALHFTSMKNCWEVDLIKWMSGMPEMEHSPTFDRTNFRNSLPEDKQDWCDTKITRYLNKMCQWGIIKKLERGKYKLLKDVIVDFSKSSTKGE